MKHFWKIIALVFIIKGLYISSGLLLPELLPVTFSTYNDISILDIFKRNDSFWYEKIATRGYPEIHNKEELGSCIDGVKQQSAWAFFPLYPTIIKATCSVSGFSFTDAAFIWSLIFPVTGLLGFYVFTRQFFNDENAAFFSTVFLMLFPFHYYFSMYYTEALFLTFTVWSFIAIGSKKILWLIPLLTLTTLVRPNGLLTAVPLFLYYSEQNKVLKGFKINFSRINKSFLINSLVFLAAPLTFALFCCYQYRVTGYWNAFSLAQMGWCRSFSFPFTILFSENEYSLYFNSVYTVAAMLFALFIMRKLPLSLNLVIWINLLLPLAAGSAISMPRYISIIFPLWIFAGYYLYSFSHKALLYTGLVCGHVFIFMFWIAGNALSY